MDAGAAPAPWLPCCHATVSNLHKCCVYSHSHPCFQFLRVYTQLWGCWTTWQLFDLLRNSPPCLQPAVHKGSDLSTFANTYFPFFLITTILTGEKLKTVTTK